MIVLPTWLLPGSRNFFFNLRFLGIFFRNSDQPGAVEDFTLVFFDFFFFFVFWGFFFFLNILFDPLLPLLVIVGLRFLFSRPVFGSLVVLGSCCLLVDLNVIEVVIVVRMFLAVVLARIVEGWFVVLVLARKIFFLRFCSFGLNLRFFCLPPEVLTGFFFAYLFSPILCFFSR